MDFLRMGWWCWNDVRTWLRIGSGGVSAIAGSVGTWRSIDQLGDHQLLEGLFHWLRCTAADIRIKIIANRCQRPVASCRKRESCCSKTWVSNLWPIRSYCAARGQICKLCIYTILAFVLNCSTAPFKANSHRVRSSSASFNFQYLLFS